MADIKYLVEVDATGAIKSIKDFDESIDHSGKTADKAEASHKGMWKQVALGQFAYETAMKAGRLFVDFVKDSISAAGDAEKADKALASALEITERPVKTLTAHFKSFAEEMQRSTIYEDDAVKGAQTLLIQLTNLDKDGIDKATKGAIGLASVMGIDLNSAASIVAKAMAGNTGALGRYGIKVDETLTAEEKQVAILDKLGSFYGRATAETETYSGKMAILQNNFQDIQEATGDALIKGLAPLMRALSDKATLEGFEKAVTAIAKALGFMAKGFGYIAELAVEIGNVGNATDRWKTSVMNAKGAIEQEIALTTQALKLKGATVQQMEAWQAAAKTDFEQAKKMLYQSEMGIGLQEKYNQVHKAAAIADANHRAASNALVTALTGTAAAQKKVTAAVEENTKGNVKNTGATKTDNKEKTTHLTLLRDMVRTQTEHNELILMGIPGMAGIAAMTAKAAKANLDFVINGKSGMDEFVDKVNSAFEQYGAAAGTAFSYVDQLVNQTYQNKSVKMENDYKKQVELINSSKMSETEKAQALEALDIEYEGKRKALAQKQAQSQKTLSAANALISTFEAAAKAYTAGPLIGPILAGIIMALGLALVYKIKSAPIPLAKGAIFSQPTLLSGADGRDYQVGDIPGGEPEIVASRSNIRKAIGLDSGRGNGAQQPLNISLALPIYIGGTKVQDVLIKLVQDASQIGKMRISAKAVA